MTIEEIRRMNINRLLEKYGSRISLATALGYPDTVYTNQLCGGHGSFGSKVARSIERKLKLPKGWMDVDNESQELIGLINRLPLDRKRQYIALIKGEVERKNGGDGAKENAA